MFESLLASRKAWLVQAIDAMVPPQRRSDLDTTIELLETLAGANLRGDAEMR